MNAKNGRHLLLLSATLLTWGACGSESQLAPEEQVGPAAPISGLYEVSGITVPTTGGHEREISGTIILAEEGDGYTATFNLTTVYPVGGQGLPAEVIGNGAGTIEGRTLRGTAHTQLVMATVPGVDPGFAYIPRTVSTRLVSTTVTTIAADGAVSIEIENAPAPGEQYTPTRTSLTGSRVSAAGIGGDSMPAMDPPGGDDS